MSDNSLRYDRMVETALRGVVREALSLAAERGLPGNHHFYITFRSDHPDVVLADHLRERFPNEMTIVVQHQFWGLKVEAWGFEITLSFSDKPERLWIPFAAITAFADPSVRFGLQFEAGQEGTEAPEPETASNQPKSTALAPAPEAKLPASLDVDKKAADSKAANKKAGTGKAKGDKKPSKRDAGEKKEAGEVVSLDAFRKK